MTRAVASHPRGRGCARQALTIRRAVDAPLVCLRVRVRRRQVKEEMAPTWQKIFDLNYPRSLDHRSFYFKQAEKKCMMTKVMVGEIKEHADVRRADEQHLRTLSMAQR